VFIYFNYVIFRLFRARVSGLLCNIELCKTSHVSSSYMIRQSYYKKLKKNIQTPNRIEIFPTIPKDNTIAIQTAEFKLCQF
jgi:hypothetical protein